ncbi:unnamed protein product [Ectocarpus sp. CCAP 1310/34]|nr:unnamed protein product [Ectocarpus sp. CCAP 1310/34]
MTRRPAASTSVLATLVLPATCGIPSLRQLPLLGFRYGHIVDAAVAPWTSRGDRRRGGAPEGDGVNVSSGRRTTTA